MARKPSKTKCPKGGKHDAHEVSSKDLSRGRVEIEFFCTKCGNSWKEIFG